MASYSVFKAKFKKTIADAIYQEVTSRTARYYHWFGKENSWQDFLSPFIPANPTEDAPGAPSDNFRYDLHVRRDILTAKLVKPSDVSYVVRRIDWISGTVYDDYDDAYDTTTGFGFGPAYSGATRLEDSNFYVLTTQYNVYKCIWNNHNSPSTVQPTGTTPDVFETSDGYKWKFMYTIPVSLRNRFLSSEYMPVSNALKASFYSAGEIESISIENGGSGYDPATTVASLEGDGQQEDNPLRILGQEGNHTINNPGSGYTTIPNAIVSEPFSTYTLFEPNLNVSVGAIIKNSTVVTQNSGIVERYYRVVSGTQLGSSAPIHDSGTISSGSSELKFVGERAKLELTISNNEVDSIIITNIGYGYSEQPIATIDGPVQVTLNWAIGAPVAQNNIVFHNNNYYEVDSGGTLGSDAPTHTSGSELNGTVNLQYVGTLADITIDAKETEAVISLVITPGIDSIFQIPVTDNVRKYTETPTVTIGAAPAGGTAATASAFILNGQLTEIRLINAGSGYLTAPSVTVAAPEKTFNALNDVNANTITYLEDHLLETGDEVVYSNNGGTDISGLTNGNTYYIIKVDDTNFQLASTEQNAENSVGVPISAGLNENHKITLSNGATAEAILGTGGEIVGYEIVDPGYGYTFANIEVQDSSGNGSGAVLSASFDKGNVDTLQANVELLAVPGAIYTVKVVDGGSGYAAANVNIVGDGEGATATATIVNGSVYEITITNPGRGYTWTEIEITGNSGSSGAVARAIMSPLGGHGSNAIDELNANAIVFYTSISRDKNQGIEINNDYRKVGLIRNLKQFNSNRRFTEDIGSGCVLITGNFNPAQLEYDMLLTKDGYKKYRIVDYTDTQILLSVFNNFTIDVGDVLTTDPTNDGRNIQPTTVTQNITVEAVSERTIDQFSGDFLFFSVRDAYAPTSDQIITVRTIVEI